MKKYISALCLTAIIANLTGCGTLLHPERNGQGQGGRLDVSIVLLDGIGLFFFLIPGIVAYAVDFSNGTIYLPHGVLGMNDTIEDLDIKDMIAVNIGKDNLTPDKIKSIVSANVGHVVFTENAKTYKAQTNGKKVEIANKKFM